jgi:hypothetical protein
MPRIENHGDNVTEWCLRTSNGSTTHDLCNKCFKVVKKNPHEFSLDLYNGDPLGEAGWLGEIEHPDYSGCDYKCAVCNKKLTYKDN